MVPAAGLAGAAPAAGAGLASDRRPLLLVLATAALAATWYGQLLVGRDEGLATLGYDSAFFQQLVWSVGHGRGFSSTFTEGSFLGLHFEPLLALPAALELAWPDPRLLSVLAALSIAAIAVAAFLFLNDLCGRPWLSATIAAAVPFWPALQEAARAGFHPETIGLALALLAGWAALRGRGWLVVAFAAAALGAKEDQAWNLVVIGIALATRPATRSGGLRLVAAALVAGTLITAVVMPLVRAGHHVDTDKYYSWLGTASPASIAHALTQPKGWFGVLLLFLSVGGIPVLRPAWLALIIPPLFGDLLSSHLPQPYLHLQYALPLVVPMLVAAGMAARSLKVPPHLLPGLAVPVAAIALLFGSLPPALAANAEPFRQRPAWEGLEVCTRQVPSRAPVAADDGLLIWLASRPTVRELSLADPGDYLVIDRAAQVPGYVDHARREAALRFVDRAILCDDGRFLLVGPVSRTLPTSQGW